MISISLSVDRGSYQSPAQPLSFGWLHMLGNPFLDYHPTCMGAALQAVRQHADFRFGKLLAVIPTICVSASKWHQPNIRRVSRFFFISKSLQKPGAAKVQQMIFQVRQVPNLSSVTRSCFTLHVRWIQEEGTTSSASVKFPVSRVPFPFQLCNYGKSPLVAFVEAYWPSLLMIAYAQ